MKEALFDDKAASDDFLADVVAETVHRAISVPGNVGEKFERMAADRITEEFFFGAEPLEAVGFDQRDSGQAVEIGVREEPELGIGDGQLGIGDWSIVCGTISDFFLI
jgi:hypothetical protein